MKTCIDSVLGNKIAGLPFWIQNTQFDDFCTYLSAISIFNQPNFNMYSTSTYSHYFIDFWTPISFTSALFLTILTFPRYRHLRAVVES